MRCRFHTHHVPWSTTTTMVNYIMKATRIAIVQVYIVVILVLLQLITIIQMPTMPWMMQRRCCSWHYVQRSRWNKCKKSTKSYVPPWRVRFMPLSRWMSEARLSCTLGRHSRSLASRQTSSVVVTHWICFYNPMMPNS